MGILRKVRGIKKSTRPGRAPSGAHNAERNSPGLVDVSGEQAGSAQDGSDVLNVVTLEGGNRAWHLRRIKDAEEVQRSLEGADTSTEALHALHLNEQRDRKSVV